MDDDALLATALDGLARRYELERKRRREPELNEIVKEFVAHVKANAGKLNMAHAGVGSVSHVTCLQLNSILGVSPTTIRFACGFG